MSLFSSTGSGQTEEIKTNSVSVELVETYELIENLYIYYAFIRIRDITKNVEY